MFELVLKNGHGNYLMPEADTRIRIRGLHHLLHFELTFAQLDSRTSEALGESRLLRLWGAGHGVATCGVTCVGRLLRLSGCPAQFAQY